MKIITQKFKVYRFNELSKKAQDVAIDDYIKFLLETEQYESMSKSMKKAVNKAEEMQTPWFTGSYVWDYCKDEILAALEDCYFLENGRYFSDENIKE